MGGPVEGTAEYDEAGIWRCRLGNGGGMGRPRLTEAVPNGLGALEWVGAVSGRVERTVLAGRVGEGSG